MIPVCEPLLGQNEAKYLLDCVRQNRISSSGEFIERFERKFSRFCGCQFGVTTTSGTSALHLALAAIGVGPGDEVIMPSFTIASTAFAAVYCGAVPVLVDSAPDTWNIDTNRISERITRRTKAIIPVHTYGNPCDMDPILKVAGKRGIAVIEDAAEAHGAKYKNQRVGGIGRVGCFSFYGNKIITCGEGGMVITNDKDIDARCRRLKNLAFQEKRRFWHEEIGFNYRMTNLQAALGLAQFEKIEEMIEKRRKNAQIYNKHLSEIGGIAFPVEQFDGENVYWMYGILIENDFGMGRDQLMRKLLEKGIETRTFFWPMHLQPVFRKMGLFPHPRYPVAEDLAKRGLYLPSGSGLKRQQIEYVCDVIKILKKKAR